MWHPSCCELLQPQTMAAANTCPTADSCGLNWDAAAAELGVERPEAKRGPQVQFTVVGCGAACADWSATLARLPVASFLRGPTPYCARNLTLPVAQG